jgi:5-methylcytosine-specific restriction protein A
MPERAFRTPESYEAEQITRKMVTPFLDARGFSVALDSFDPTKKSQSQIIHATDPTGRSVRIRVKLCWPSRKATPGKSTGYASQLIGKITDGDSFASIKRYVEGARNERITHFAFVVREGAEITHAALIPVSELAPVWRGQRAAYDSLIREGRLGRRKSNPAENGSSPTLYVQDDEAQEAEDALWNHRGVQNLIKMKIIIGENLNSKSGVDDTFDDLPSLDFSLLGSDGAARVLTQRSSVKRDQRVRAEVLRRAGGACERAICGATRSFVGFFEVHHILGAEVSDRVYNCVALCPNCHRESHFSPNRDAINKDLLEFAMRFKRG